MEFKKENISLKEKKPFVDDMKRFVSKEAGRFKTETEDAAISKIDGSIEKAIRFSSEKNKTNSNKYSQILQEIQKEKEALTEAVDPSISIHPSRNQFSDPSYSLFHTEGEDKIERVENHVDKREAAVENMLERNASCGKDASFSKNGCGKDVLSSKDVLLFQEKTAKDVQEKNEKQRDPSSPSSGEKMTDTPYPLIHKEALDNFSAVEKQVDNQKKIGDNAWKMKEDCGKEEIFSTNAWEKANFASKEDASFHSKQEELQRKEEKIKKEKKKEQKRAASKTAVATMLQAKKELSNELVNDKATGDAMKDGVRGLLKSAVDLLNPMRILKSLGAKLGLLIAPYVAVFLSMASVLLIVILLVFSVLQPLSNVTDGIGNFLSGLRVENSALRNTTLTQEEIEAILLASGADETQKQVLSFALSKVGYPYSQPRRTSGTAFDCSSLAFYAWQHAGVDISFGGNYPPTAASGAKMLNDAGKSLTSMDLKPGDLVYYGGSDNGRYLGIYHVAIYVGNGKSVEALNDTYGVVYQTLKTKNAVMVCRPNK